MEYQDTEFVDRLGREPVYCFTSDIDWANEAMIGYTLDFFKDYGIPLTPFITHKSKKIVEYYKGCKSCFVGLHPNFLPESTHGRKYGEIISHVVDLWPNAKAYRSHCFFDNHFVSKRFYEMGFRYDSNLYMHLRGNIMPLKHSSGMVRFPVFLEDDIYLSKTEKIDFSEIREYVVSAGIKVFNFHPIHLSLNSPSNKYSKEVEIHESGDFRDHVFEKEGVRTFLEEIIDYVLDNQGLGLFYLDDLFTRIYGRNDVE